MTDEHILLSLLDVSVSLGLLATMLVLFVRGDLLSRKSMEEVIGKTIKNVLQELRNSE